MAESKMAVYGAMAANVAIAVTKFIAAGVTGSSSMLSEGIHSLVDTGNGCLLLVGMVRSKRPPTREHPYGHGKELYFWTLMVGVLIFGAGGGISIYEGILHVRHPAPLEDATWNYAVLACAALFEGASFAIGWRQFTADRKGKPILAALQASKDPSLLSVLAEDSAALAGLLIAGIGVFLSHFFKEPAIDGIASIVIGALLAGVAVVLIHQSRGLLVGEGISATTATRIRALAQAESAVTEVGPILSMYIGPDEALVTLSVQVDPLLPSGEVAHAVQRIESEIRALFPPIRRVYIEIGPPGQHPARNPALGPHG